MSTYSLWKTMRLLFESHSTNAIPNAVNPCPFTHFSIHNLSCTFSPNSLRQCRSMMPFQTPSTCILSDTVNSSSFKHCQLTFFPQDIKAILSGGHVTGLDILVFRFSEKRVGIWDTQNWVSKYAIYLMSFTRMYGFSIQVLLHFVSMKCRILFSRHI